MLIQPTQTEVDQRAARISGAMSASRRSGYPMSAAWHRGEARLFTVLMLIGFCQSGAMLSGCSPAPPASPCLIGDDIGLIDGSRVNPFPSAHLLRVDDDSATGCRVDLRPDSIPVGDSDPTDLARFNRRDGFSPSGGLWIQLGVAIDGSSLPPLADPQQSLTSDAAVQLWNLDSGERIPCFAELDAWEPQSDAERSLLIRPLAAMGFGTRVAAVITDNLRRADGSPWQGPEEFLSIRAGSQPDGRSDALFSHYFDVVQRLKQHGLNPDRIQFAWDFVTASEANLRAPLDRVLETMRAELPADPSHHPTTNISLIRDVDEDDVLTDGLWREVRGAVELTHFLWADDPQDLDPSEHDGGMFLLDEQGLPQPRATDSAYFALIVPESLRDAPAGSAPVLVFGHGLFNAAQDYLSAADDPSSVIALCSSMQAICLGGEWRGLTTRDRSDAVRAATNLSRFPLLTDKLIQGVSNQLAMARLMRTDFTDQPFLQAAAGGSLVDPDRIYYYGISLGSIAGGVFLANSEIVTSGVLHVPGAQWSVMLERSSNWEPLEGFFTATLPSAPQRQLFYAASQLLWDPVDPMNHISGLRQKNSLWQIAVGDEQVPNFCAETLARSLDLPLITPAVHRVFGLQQAETPLGPGASGLFQFHPGMPLPPETNRPAPVTGAHTAVRQYAEAREQILVFLHQGIEGTIIHPCDGPCLLSEL